MYSKKIKIVICVLAILAIVFCIGNTSNFLVDIDGYKVHEEEYMYYVEKGKSAIYNHFYHTYGIQAGELEWDKDYGDGKPIDQLVERCNREVIDNNLVWKVAYEKEIVNYHNFQDFKKVWKHEMDRRQKDYRTGKVVYGPLNMRLMEYYDYALADLEVRVMEAIWEDIAYTDEQLEDYYEEIKEEAYVRDKQIKGIKISASTRNNEQSLEAIRKELLQMSDTATAIENIKSQGIFEVSEVVFDEETARMDAMKQPELKAYVMTLSVGEITPVFVNNISSDFIVVTEVVEEGYYTFEKVKEAVEQSCREKVFDTYMDSLVNKMIVEVNEETIKTNIWEGLND